MKPAMIAAAILLSACAATPGVEAQTPDAQVAGEPDGEPLLRSNGDACPPGAKAHPRPNSYAEIRAGGCRPKADWDRVRELNRAFGACLARAKKPNVEAMAAACKTRKMPDPIVGY